MNNFYEEKRAKLGIHRLRTDEQKKLFQDFINAGGEVVDLIPDEKSNLNRKLEEWIREKENEYKRKLAEETKNETALRLKETKNVENKINNTTYGKVIPRKKVKKEDNPTPYYFSRLASKLTCIIFGIFSIFRNDFTSGFLELTFYKFQTYMLEAQEILYNIFQTDEKLTERIRKFLLRAGYTYYFEIVYRFYLLYDEKIFAGLFDSTQDYDNPVSLSKPYFIELFKRILSIYRYYPAINNAFSKILEEEKRICGIDLRLNEARLNRLFEISKFVFEKYFPKLLMLIDFYYKEEMLSRKKARSFKDFLNITEKDMMGYWNKLWEEQTKEKEQKKVEETKPISPEEKFDKKLTPSITEGLKFINNNINFLNIQNYYVSIKDPKMLLSFNDKIFITWVLLECLDKCFSPLFLSNNVIYQATFHSGQKVDVKSNIKDLYYEINSNYKNFKEYLTIVNELNKTTSVLGGGKELFSLTQKLEMQRAQISKKIRTDTAIILKRLIDNIELIFIDYNFEKKMVLNPEEFVSLESTFCGKKFTYTRKIIDMFKDVYDFVSAFYFLLNDGDLSGTLISVVKPKYLSWIEEEKTSTPDETGKAY